LSIKRLPTEGALSFPHLADARYSQHLCHLEQPKCFHRAVSIYTAIAITRYVSAPGNT
jgi:hypothetical protein